MWYMSILNLDIMNNGQDNLKRAKQIIIVLFGLFFAIRLQDASTGALSSSWVPLALMGATIIGLPLLAGLLSHRKGGDILNDR
jgi:hypothetical protein